MKNVYIILKLWVNTAYMIVEFVKGQLKKYNLIRLISTKNKNTGRVLLTLIIQYIQLLILCFAFIVMNVIHFTLGA